MAWVIHSGLGIVQTSLHGSARASQSGPPLPWRVGLAGCVIVGARGVAFSSQGRISLWSVRAWHGPVFFPDAIPGCWHW